MEIKKFLENKILGDKDFFKLNRNNISKNRQPVWHAISLQNISSILENMTLEPHTSQRYWPDGKRRKENDPDYEDSYWMYGWSTTRKKEYAMGWNGIVLELDLDEISNRFQIKPFSWNFLFNHKTNNRKEHEEFIVSSYVEKSIPQMKKEDEDNINKLDDLYDKMYLETDPLIKDSIKKQIEDLDKIPSWMTRWQSPHGKSIDLKTCLNGIYLDESYVSLCGKEDPVIKSIIEHELFKGLFVSPHNNKKINKNITP